MAATPENAKKKLHRLEDQLRSVDKDIKEFKEIFSEFGQEDKEIAIAGILSIQYGNTCEMLYAGMDERFKKFMPQYLNIRNMLKTLNGPLIEDVCGVIWVV